jgi:HEAT repeat protein
MEPFPPMMVAACVSLAAMLAAVGRRKARIRSWHRAAAAARLDDVRSGSRLGSAFVEGRSGGLHVRLEGYRRGRYEAGTRIVIQGLARLSVRRESAATAIEKRFLGETEVELGDPAFDRQCFVNASAPLAFAVFGPEARRLLASALAGHLQVDEHHVLGARASLSEGTLRLECRDGWSTSGERVSELLRGGLRLARQLTLPPDLPLRIAQNLKREPEPGVRLTSLLTLAREYPTNPATRPALLAARDDASAEVRLRAALALGEEGRATLLALVASETTDDGCAARAVAALGEQLPEAEATRALRLALDSGRSETARACLETLGTRSSTTAEATLLAALWNAEVPVRIAAARVLGRVGSVAVVRDLLTMSESGPGEVRSAARQAIAAIQSRLPGASPGQLSLAGGEAGALSVVEDTAGGLSVVEDTAAGLPISETRSDAGAVETPQDAPDASYALPQARTRQSE